MRFYQSNKRELAYQWLSVSSLHNSFSSKDTRWSSVRTRHSPLIQVLIHISPSELFRHSHSLIIKIGGNKNDNRNARTRRNLE